MATIIVIVGEENSLMCVRGIIRVSELSNGVGIICDDSALLIKDGDHYHWTRSDHRGVVSSVVVVVVAKGGNGIGMFYAGMHEN